MIVTAQTPVLRQLTSWLFRFLVDTLATKELFWDHPGMVTTDGRAFIAELAFSGSLFLTAAHRHCSAEWSFVDFFLWGLRLDDDAVRMAFGLCLDIAFMYPVTASVCNI